MTRAPAAGRLRDASLGSGERNYAMWIHLSPLVGFVVLGPFAGFIPLILWLARREASPFNDDHGREAVNFSITGAIVFIAGLTVIGMIIWPIWAVVAVIGIVRAATAASAGEYFRYPMTIRFI